MHLKSQCQSQSQTKNSNSLEIPSQWETISQVQAYQLFRINIKHKEKKIGSLSNLTFPKVIVHIPRHDCKTNWSWGNVIIDNLFLIFYTLKEKISDLNGYPPSISFFFIFNNMDEFMQEFEDFVTQTQRDSSFRDSISKFDSLFLHEFNKLESNKKMWCSQFYFCSSVKWWAYSVQAWPWK